MSRKTILQTEAPSIVNVDPLECPFREFRDNELTIDTWGMSTAAYKAWVNAANVKAMPKSADSTQRAGTINQSPKAAGLQVKPGSDKSKPFMATSLLWVDEQSQPLPRSVRQYLHGWIRAEDLAMDRWGAEVIIFDENDQLNKMTIADVQLCHAQVLFRSSFCRKVLSACFALERMEHLTVEHQWESFTCTYGPEGWRAKCHIYSPGLKPGGGIQHKPTLSKNGCYLVRLFYLGAWRCVWVNDQVPVDTSGAPLLPFSPLLTHPPAKPGSTRVPPAVTASVVYLWPLLITKALLKLAAPDMSSDIDADGVEDETMLEFDILHALIGGVNIRHYKPKTIDELWAMMTIEVPIFSWDTEEDTSTVKSRSTKKPTAKELASVVKQRSAMTYAVIKDTKELQPYVLPGITPGHEMSLFVMMARDVPIKKPLPEPEVALWKYYRWVDWARRHGLYAAYDCPRTKYIKVNGLLKSSYAPHLLDVQSTESITKGFIEEHLVSTQTQKGDDDGPRKKKAQKSQIPPSSMLSQQAKAELREWIQMDAFYALLKYYQVIFYPSLYCFTSAGSNPPLRTNVKTVKMTDIVAPKYGPLYLQLDGPDVNKLRLCISTLHPRVLSNSGFPLDDYIDPAHVVLEKFEWFKDTPLPDQKAFLSARRYNSLEIDLDPGRHFFRIWTHYRVNWHIMMISESSLLLNTRDVVLGAAVHECHWSSKFLLNLGSSFSNWTKSSRSTQNTILTDREFFSSYLPDLTWDRDVVGYDRHLLHWMFRQALQSHLLKVMNQMEWKAVTHVLRKYFCDPDFGFPIKPCSAKSLREITNVEICDCLMPEVEEIEGLEEQELRDQVTFAAEPEHELSEEEVPIVAPEIMDKLLKAPELPVTSQICEMATDVLPCAVLKEEREKTVKKHEAASILQAYWRGTWARKVLKANITFTPEIIKLMNERAFGTLEGLSKLMNEFFFMWPGAKYAYSVASALSGDCGLQQHTGMTIVTTKCKWIPHFKGVFYCHVPVKVHFDIQSSVAHSTVEVYNNDSGAHLPQVYNSHITFDFAPNIMGYTVMGHGTLSEVSDISYEENWQLTIMSCLSDAFHICDNSEFCKELPLPQASKLHIDEVFVPNRRNILGGIKIVVQKHEAVSFRAAASSTDLEMVATLRLLLPDGKSEEISKCSGKGEIYWPYIRLDATPIKRQQISAGLFINRSTTRSPKSPKSLLHAKNRSTSKMKLVAHDFKMYSIEVTCPAGWPITLDQWRRVNEVRNTHDSLEFNIQKKATAAVKEKDKGKQGAKEKPEKAQQVIRAAQQPQPGDAFVELECALAVGSGAVATRDDERDLAYLNARRVWAALDSLRNQTGATIRKEFRADFLVAPPMPTGMQSSSYASGLTESTPHLIEGEHENEENKDGDIPRPSPVSGTEEFEMTVETEEEAHYLLMPDLLRDKFIPLDFLPICTKEKNEEECILISPDMAEAAKNDRHARLEAALQRMHELQIFNEEHVLGRQKSRCKLLENLFVDATFTPDLIEMMEQKEEAIATEINLRNLSATKKKTEAKKK